jgi:HlyD family secretion protein
MKKIKHLPQKLVYFAVGVAVVTALVLALRPTPMRVDTQAVERKDLYVTVDAEGKTRLRDRFVFSAPVEGRLARIQWSAGDWLNQGDVVARIDALPLNTKVREARARLRELQAQRRGVETLRPKQQALDQAEARIRAHQALLGEARAKGLQARSSLEQAQRDRQRLEGLATEGAIPRQDWENAQLLETIRARELEIARQEVERIQAEMEAAEEELSRLRAERRDPDYQLDVYDAQIASLQAELVKLADDAARTTITAPVSGQVLRVLEESERYVAEGSPLLELGNPQELELVIDVLSTDAVKVKPGARIMIEHWGGERTLDAKVRHVEPSAFTEISALGVEEQRVNVIGDWVDYPPALGDGYRVEARIVVWEGKEVLAIPLSALFRCEGDWCAFVAEEGKAQRRPVELGQRSNFEAVIQRGLQEGEVVILHPSEQIKPGSAVVPRL